MFPVTQQQHSPCPFCTSTQLYGVEVVAGLYLVQCGDCGAQGPHRPTPAEALVRWDQRGELEPRRCAWCEGLFLPQAVDQRYCERLCAQTAQEATRTARRTLRHRQLPAQADDAALEYLRHAAATRQWATTHTALRRAESEGHHEP